MYLMILATSLWLISQNGYAQSKLNNLSNISNQNSIINQLISKLNDSSNKKILVVSHRADWRNAPENSLQAIKNCIEMGVDMVEIDIRETKDGQLILMHDESIDRTTTGSGLVSEWTLDSLKTLQLKDGLGVPTIHKIPTLEEALLLSKDRVLVNLDKSYEIFDKCYSIISKTETTNQVVIKGKKKLNDVIHEFGEYLDKVKFMPIISLPSDNADSIIDEYINSENKPVAIEFTLTNDSIKQISKFEDYRNSGVSIWVNALWPKQNGGHDDEKAAIDPTVYDWFIVNNVNIIQTDRPKLLIDYLRSKGLHN